MPGFDIRTPYNFHMTFANGHTVSIAIGPGSYSDNHDAPFEGREEARWSTNLAEVAAWGPDGEWLEKSPRSYQSADEVLAWMQEVAAL